jgi:5-methylcytosine-specific restriction endonuclease McrA
MAKRQMIWAGRLYEAILTVLGRKCRRCGSTHNLELDLIDPTADVGGKHHRQWNKSQRMTFYRRQLLKNNLQTLCGKCNTRKRSEQPCLFEQL